MVAPSTVLMNSNNCWFKTSIDQKIKGEAPAPLSKDTWEHAQRLYKNYQGVPLWLTGDGLDKPRAGALMFAGSLTWLSWRAARARAASEGYGPHAD